MDDAVAQTNGMKKREEIAVQDKKNKIMHVFNTGKRKWQTLNKHAHIIFFSFIGPLWLIGARTNACTQTMLGRICTIEKKIEKRSLNG